LLPLPVALLDLGVGLPFPSDEHMWWCSGQRNNCMRPTADCKLVNLCSSGDFQMLPGSIKLWGFWASAWVQMLPGLTKPGILLWFLVFWLGYVNSSLLILLMNLPHIEAARTSVHQVLAPEVAVVAGRFGV
jgi:hypothetical protein